MNQVLIKYTRPDGFIFEGLAETLLKKEELTADEKKRISLGVEFFATSEIQPAPIHFSEDGAILDFIMLASGPYMTDEEADRYYSDVADFYELNPSFSMADCDNTEAF